MGWYSPKKAQTSSKSLSFEQQKLNYRFKNPTCHVTNRYTVHPGVEGMSVNNCEIDFLPNIIYNTHNILGQIVILWKNPIVCRGWARLLEAARLRSATLIVGQKPRDQTFSLGLLEFFIRSPKVKVDWDFALKKTVNSEAEAGLGLSLRGWHLLVREHIHTPMHTQTVQIKELRAAHCQNFWVFFQFKDFTKL